MLVRVARWITIELYQCSSCISSRLRLLLIFVSWEMHRLKERGTLGILHLICCAAEDWRCWVRNKVYSLLKELVCWKTLAIWVSNCCTSCLLLLVTKCMKETWLTLSNWRHLLGLRRWLNDLSELSFGLHCCMHSKHKISWWVWWSQVLFSLTYSSLGSTRLIICWAPFESCVFLSWRRYLKYALC